MKRNIPLIYIISALMWARFFIPVIALFYIASQVPLEQFTIIMSIFAGVILLFEVPSGVLADLLGKKNTLLLSRAFYIVELYLLAFHNGFWIFLIAKIISGLGVSLSSGTDESLLYDTLKRLRQTKRFKKIIGIKITITTISMAVVFIIGGYLFSMHPKLPAKASIPFVAIGFFLTFFLKEPYKSSKKANLVNAYIHLKEGLIYFWNHSYVKYLVFYSFPIFAAISISLTISSAYFQKILIPISLIGVVAFAVSLITALASKKADYIEERLGQKKSLRSIQIALVVGVFLISLMINYIGVVFYLIIGAVQGFYDVIISQYTNEHIETSHRATMLSIKNLFGNLGIFILFPVVGYITKFKSMNASFMFLGIFLIVCMILLFAYSKKLKLSQIE
jgi:MFS family permease